MLNSFDGTPRGALHRAQRVGHAEAQRGEVQRGLQGSSAYSVILINNNDNIMIVSFQMGSI